MIWTSHLVILSLGLLLPASTMLQFFDHFLPSHAMLPSMCHKKKKEGGGSESVEISHKGYCESL